MKILNIICIDIFSIKDSQGVTLCLVNLKQSMF